MSNLENPAWYSQQQAIGLANTTLNTTITTHPYTLQQHTQIYTGAGTSGGWNPNPDVDVAHLVLGEARDGESWFVTMRRIVDEYREMKQALKELATLADCHGEDTVCL